MARQLSTLELEPMYRAVVFHKYSGLHGLSMSTYIDRDGRTYEYHRVYVFGPYEKQGPAKAMVKREIGYADIGYRNYCNYDDPARPVYKPSDVQGIIESSVAIWGLHG